MPTRATPTRRAAARIDVRRHAEVDEERRRRRASAARARPHPAPARRRRPRAPGAQLRAVRAEGLQRERLGLRPLAASSAAVSGVRLTMRSGSSCAARAGSRSGASSARPRPGRPAELAPAEVLEHPLGGQVPERGCAHAPATGAARAAPSPAPRPSADRAPGHRCGALRASSQAPRSWAAISCSPVWAESSPQASRNRCSTAASPVQARSRRAASARSGSRPASARKTSQAASAGRRAVLGGEHHLDAVAGADVEDLGSAERGAQGGEA